MARKGKHVTKVCGWHDWRLIYTSNNGEIIYCLCQICGSDTRMYREEYGGYLGIKSIREQYGLGSEVQQATDK